MKRSWLNNVQTLPFCFCPILITSCLRTKDTRLSARYIFAFQESLGTRLLVDSCEAAVFSSVRTSACSGMRTAYRKQRTYVDTNSGFVRLNWVHSLPSCSRLLVEWGNLPPWPTTGLHPCWQGARPAIPPCDSLATFSSELFTTEVSHHLSARGPFAF